MERARRSVVTSARVSSAPGGARLLVEYTHPGRRGLRRRAEATFRRLLCCSCPTELFLLCSIDMLGNRGKCWYAKAATLAVQALTLC